MEWYKKLYTGESIRDKSEKIKWKINHNAGQIQIYIISLASNQENLLDLIPAREIMQKGYPRKNLFIVGLAKGREEAVEVAQQIVLEVYENTGGFRVREYLTGMVTESRGKT